MSVKESILDMSKRGLPEPKDGPPVREIKAKEPTLHPANEALRTRLGDAKKEWSLSNADLCLKMGFSSAVWSQYLAPEGNKYPGDIPRLEKRIEDFLRTEATRQMYGVETVSCDVYKQFDSAFHLIRETNDVGALMAESGEGKSRAIELYQKENPTSIMFRVFSWSNDKKSIEGTMFSAVGSFGYNTKMRRADYMVKMLRGSNRLLIADDAHKLTRPALQYLFDFHDETGCPLGLVGTLELEEKLADDAQRLSRVGLRFEIRPDDPKDLIAHLIKTLAPDANGEAQELHELCLQVVKMNGHFRSVNKQLKLASKLKAKSRKGITWAEAFRQAHTHLLRDERLV